MPQSTPCPESQIGKYHGKGGIKTETVNIPGNLKMVFISHGNTILPRDAPWAHRSCAFSNNMADSFILRLF
jgi:hypothetical protein